MRWRTPIPSSCRARSFPRSFRFPTRLPPPWRRRKSLTLRSPRSRARPLARRSAVRRGDTRVRLHRGGRLPSQLLPEVVDPSTSIRITGTALVGATIGSDDYILVHNVGGGIMNWAALVSSRTAPGWFDPGSHVGGKRRHGAGLGFAGKASRRARIRPGSSSMPGHSPGMLPSP